MGIVQGGAGRALVLTAALLAAPGCVPLGDVIASPRLPGSARSMVVDGEVRSVDARRGRFELRSNRGTRTVSADRATRVVYRGTSYRVDALERGDLVRVWIELDERGNAWADRVDVRHSVRERDRDRRSEVGWGRVERLEGRVGEVDLRRNYFTVEGGWRSSTVVHLPEDLDKKERRDVAALRRGDRVDLDVRRLADGEAVLERLR